MLPRYHARLEARCYGNMEEVRFLWDDVMTRHGREAQYWLEYAELERFVSLSVWEFACLSVCCLNVSLLSIWSLWLIIHSDKHVYTCRRAKPRTITHTHIHMHAHMRTCTRTHTHHTHRYCGDVEACRKILQRAVNSASDDPEGVCQALLEFEREVGSLDSYEGAMERCVAQLRRVKERREKVREGGCCEGVCVVRQY